MAKLKVQRGRFRLLFLLPMFAMHFSVLANAYPLQDPAPHVSLSASREIGPPAHNDAAATNPATTSTTISSLPSFGDDDPLTAAYARIRTTVQPMVGLVSLSMLLAIGMVAWEDYAATNLWPSRRMIVESTTLVSEADPQQLLSNSGHFTFGARTIHGLGFGKSERVRLLQHTDANAAAALLPEIRAYNEVLEEHRDQRVARWQSSATSSTADDQALMEGAVHDLQQILLQVLKLEALAQDYQWDQIHSMIQSSILPKLEPAASVLRLHLKADKIGYEEVGFDWGSCAWRHCGALADSQEALDELDHLLGVLEPPECLFCLNVAERSIRDMLAVVPAHYRATEGMPLYIPYQSAHYSEDDELGDDTAVLDQDYLKMLQQLRTSNDGSPDEGTDDS